MIIIFVLSFSIIIIMKYISSDKYDKKIIDNLFASSNLDVQKGSLLDYLVINPEKYAIDKPGDFCDRLFLIIRECSYEHTQDASATLEYH